MKRLKNQNRTMLTPAIFLSLSVGAMAQQLVCDHESLTARDFPDGSILQVYASNDLQTWQPRFEMAAAGRLPLPRTNAFYRARVKPSFPRIDFTCPTVCTGRLFHTTGTATELLVNVGGLTVTHQEFGLTNGRPRLIYCEWEYGYTLLPIGTNRLEFDFLDANNNHIATNFTVLVLPGEPLTIEHPANNALVVGETTTLIGRTEATSGTVTCGTLTAPIHNDGHFYFVGLPVSETNELTVRSGTNVVTVSFGKSHISFSGNISGRTVTGTLDPSNTLNIGGRKLRPDASGSWKLDLTLPPVNGMLPFSVQPSNGPSSTGVLSTQYDQTGYYVTSHALSYHYTYENSNDPTSHVKDIRTSLGSDGSVSATFRREYYPSRISCPGICEASYSGDHMILWLDSEDGPCNYIESRRYFPEFGLIDYHDETSKMWFYHDELQIQEMSSCGLHIAGNSGRTFQIALEVSLYSSMRDGSAGDENTGGGPTSPVKVGYIGGLPTDSFGVVRFNVIEGHNYNITPTLTPMNQGWFFYEFDWNEIPIATL